MTNGAIKYSGFDFQEWLNEAIRIFWDGGKRRYKTARKSMDTWFGNPLIENLANGKLTLVDPPDLIVYEMSENELKDAFLPIIISLCISVRACSGDISRLDDEWIRIITFIMSGELASKINKKEMLLFSRLVDEIIKMLDKADVPASFIEQVDSLKNKVNKML